MLMWLLLDAYQLKLDSLMSKMNEAVEMAQGMEERHNLTEEKHQSEVDSLNRKITSLTEQANDSQETITSLRNELLQGILRDSGYVCGSCVMLIT